MPSSDPAKAHLPPPSSVVETMTFSPPRPLAPGAAPGLPTTYTILRTNEFDPKDKNKEVHPLALAPLVVSDDFAGTVCFGVQV